MLGRQSEARHLSHIVNTVFRLLGWAVAESGPKAADFAAAAQALGVRVDVSEMHRGSVWVDNTESGKSDLSSCIKDVLQTGELSTADALRLRERMQFTSGQVFGRLSRAALSKVTHHAYRSSRARTSKHLQTALSLYQRFLLSGQPRLVSCGIRDTWFVYTEASFEVVNEIATAGFGGVLVNPSGMCISHFGFVLEGASLDRLNPSAKKTIIHECEFLAVAIALDDLEFSNYIADIVTFSRLICRT